MPKKIWVTLIALSLMPFWFLRATLPVQATSWTKVHQNGAADWGFYNLVDFNGYIYGSTGSWGAAPAKIIRSSDGASWSEVIADGYGDTNNKSITFQKELNDYLYSITYNSATGAEVWRCSKASGCDAQVDWAQVNTDGFGDANNLNGFKLTYFNNALFTATYNGNTGTEVWRCLTSTGCDAQADWSQVNTDGFNSVFNDRAWGGLYSFNDYLYVFTMNTSVGTEVWRCSKASGCDMDDWNQVNTDGFGDANNYSSGPAVNYNGTMYIGTNNNASGGQIWKTTDGTNWTQITSAGILTAANLGIYPIGLINGCLYFGTQNNFGAELWKTCDSGSTWTQDNSSGFDSATNVEIDAFTFFKSNIYVGTWNNTNGGAIYRAPFTAMSLPASTTTAIYSAKYKTKYTHQLTASSGTAPYTYVKASGSLPPGLSLSSSGLISGKPKKLGKYSFAVTVFDSGTPTQVASQSFRITVFKGKLRINKNARTTFSKNVNLTISGNDGKKKDIKYMRFSNNGKKWSKWRRYKTNYNNWNITAKKYGGKTKKGTKTVYVQFKTKGGIISKAFTDKIRYR